MSAGAAIVVRQGEAETIGAEIVPGFDHSSYRGEVFGVILALQVFFSADLFIDCSAVVGILGMMIEARRYGFSFGPIKHWDLWQQVWAHVLHRPWEALRVFKVDSHKDVTQIVNPFELWKTRFNDRVDAIVKQVLRNDHASLLHRMQLLYNDHLQECDLLHQFHSFWVSTNVKLMNASKKGDQTVGATPDFASFVRAGSGQCVAVRWSSDPRLQNFPFGQTFTLRFLDWFARVPWLDGSHHTCVLEIYAAFSLETMTMMPVRFKSLKGRQRRGGSCYLLRDENVKADAAEADLSGQLRCFVQFFKWLLGLFGFDCFSCYRGSVQNLGYLSQTTYFHHSLQLPNQERVSRVLWEYFHKDARATHNLKNVWKPSLAGA